MDQTLSSQPAQKLKSGSAGSGVVKVPIRVKITFPYLVLALAVLTGAAYLVVRIVFDTTQERFSNQLIEAGKLSSEWMVREENRLLKSLRLLTYTQGLPEALQVGDADGIQELAYGIVAGQQEEHVLFLDSAGNLVLSIHHTAGGKLEDYAFSTGGGERLLGYDFVRQALSCQQDQNGDKFAGLIGSGNRGIFYVSGPVVLPDGSCSGVVLVGKSLETMAAQLRSESLAQVTLYNSSGTPVASTISTPQPINGLLAAQINTRLTPAAFERGLENARSYSMFEINYAELIIPWRARGDVDLGLMGISLPKNFWVTTSTVTRMQIASIVMALILLVVTVGVMVANWITLPLMGLVQASSKVAEGDLEVQVQPQGNDEIAFLTENFNQMVSNLNQTRKDLVQAYDDTIIGWGKMLDQRDQITQGHTQRVMDLTLHLSRKLGLADEELIHIRRGAALHDIGKLAIPDSILKKNGGLDEDEWEVMRLHPQYAYETLYPIEFLRPALDIPYYHHERWDGSGYPFGLAGEGIPLAARIFAVVDVWDAMTNDRPYHRGQKPQKVMEYIRSYSGILFDPQVVQCFVEMMQEPEPRYITRRAAAVV